MKFPIQDDRSPEALAISRFLQDSSLFSMLGAKARSQLAASATLLSLRGGDVLYRRDDTADSLYAVVSGRLRAERQGDNGEITVQEFYDGLQEAGLTVSNDTILKLFQSFDRDSDGSVKKRELTTVLYPPPPRPGGSTSWSTTR